MRKSVKYVDNSLYINSATKYEFTTALNKAQPDKLFVSNIYDLNLSGYENLFAYMTGLHINKCMSVNTVFFSFYSVCIQELSITFCGLRSFSFIQFLSPSLRVLVLDNNKLQFSNELILLQLFPLLRTFSIYNNPLSTFHNSDIKTLYAVPLQINQIWIYDTNQQSKHKNAFQFGSQLCLNDYYKIEICKKGANPFLKCFQYFSENKTQTNRIKNIKRINHKIFTKEKSENDQKMKRNNEIHNGIFRIGLTLCNFRLGPE
ncbi:Leucine-rich_repeat domain superfamily [Hexamita inflata]|uniref:Leucine-rich repeat domain superfamily n=1 Tax=Hexamita inflata TaxID=28002 RepID=A0AA86NQ48_9EUKA|nr:Leucine-rich repeat domain superfamily [Hexamita inflata]